MCELREESKPGTPTTQYQAGGNGFVGNVFQAMHLNVIAP